MQTDTCTLEGKLKSEDWTAALHSPVKLYKSATDTEDAAIKLFFLFFVFLS